MFLRNGFTDGFRIPSTILDDPPKASYTNHASARQHHLVLQRYIAEELSMGRLAGPFVAPPFKNFVVSPLGVVPKKEAGKFRIIHDLSFPKQNSVNAHIDPSFKTVNYELWTIVFQFCKH